MQAQFFHGDPLMVDHTPSGAVSAGDVVLVGSEPRMAHLDIEAGRLRALAAGGGVYRVAKATGASTAIAAGAVVYWDAGDGVVTTSADSGANKRFGATVAATVDADAVAVVKHQPIA